MPRGTKRGREEADDGAAEEVEVEADAAEGEVEADATPWNRRGKQTAAGHIPSNRGDKRARTATYSRKKNATETAKAGAAPSRSKGGDAAAPGPSRAAHEGRLA